MKAIVLLSGGIDSAAALYWAKGQGWKTYALTFDYEREQSPELRGAKAIARSAGVRHFVEKVEFYKRLRGSPSSSRSKIVDEERGISRAYVPARNIVFLGMAAAYAETLGADTIVTGHNLGDAERFPDATGPFFDVFDELLRLGLKSSQSGRQVKVLAPFNGMTKEEVLREALKLGVPLKATWSCYNNGRRPCGVCYGCRARSRAFRAVGVEDPLTVV